MSGLYSKISNPVLTNLKLTATNDVSLQRGLSAAAARPVPRQPAGRAGPLHRQGPVGDQADRQVGKETKEFVYEVTFPDKTDDEQALRRAAVGAAQGRLPARPDPRQRREEGTGGRGDGAGQEVRHHHAVHQLPDRARTPPCRWPPARRRRTASRTCSFNAPAPAAPPPALAARPGGAAPSRSRWRSSPSGTRQKPGDLDAEPRQLRRQGPAARPATRRATAGQAPQGRQGQEGRLRPGPRAACAARTRTASRPASWAWICPARRPTCATRRGWTRRPSRTSTAATAWRSAASGSTRASTPRCRRVTVKAQSDAYFSCWNGTRRSRTCCRSATTSSG